jgi:hypothetical protein
MAGVASGADSLDWQPTARISANTLVRHCINPV